MAANAPLPIATQGCRLLGLPEELIDLIAHELELADLNAFCRTCRRLYRLSFETLCRLYEATSSLEQTCIGWAIWSGKGRLDVINRAIEHGRVVAKLSDLSIASVRGQAHIVRRLLQVPNVVQEWKATATKDRPLHARDDSPLACAVRNCHGEVVDVLLAVPSVTDVAISSTECAMATCIEPAICTAARKDMAKFIGPLLDRGASIESTDALGKTPVLIAAHQGSSNAFVELVRRGADLYKVPHNGHSLMHLAARHNTAMVQALIDKGHPLNSLSAGDNRTPLAVAAMHNRCDVLRSLVKQGAEFTVESSSGKTLLMIAAHNGRADFVRTLLSMDIDVDAVDREGKTALFHALSSGGTSIGNLSRVCEALLEGGADPNHVCQEGSTALAELCGCAYYSKYNGRALVHIFVHMNRFGARDLNPRASSGGLYLMGWAIHSEQTSLLDVMLRAGVKLDFDKCASSHWNPDAPAYFLDLIHTPKMLYWLLDHGMAVDFRDRRGRPLLHNVLGDHQSLLRHALFRAGANIEAADLDGNTPLHRACMDGDIHCKPVINELIKRGANLWSTNDEGLTPLDVAEHHEWPIAVKILKRHIKKQRLDERAEGRARRIRCITNVFEHEGPSLDALFG